MLSDACHDERFCPSILTQAPYRDAISKAEVPVQALPIFHSPQVPRIPTLKKNFK
jgi:hypothetical protein